jgi:hypothetical protein
MERRIFPTPARLSGAVMNQHSLILITLASVTVAADEPVRMAEQFPAGYQYRVTSTTTLKGTLTVPGDGEKAKPQQMAVAGRGELRYDERVLTPAENGLDPKTIRVYERIGFHRRVGERDQEATVRGSVRRMVILRNKGSQIEVPFSPDGPLLWGELDQVRTDVFSPALTGLLPEGLVRPGDRWDATRAAVAELTDMEHIESGGLECRFEGVTVAAQRRLARVSFRGTIKGVNEDGSVRQELKGELHFDLESNHVSFLDLNGVKSLLDKTGQEVGRIEGEFHLQRHANVRSGDLADDVLARLSLDPNAENTQLLYDDPDLGVRFLYPRRWRVGVVRGRQLDIDEAGGTAGLRITVEPTAKVPTAAQFLAEVKTFLGKQEKVRILHAEPPVRLSAAPQELDSFRVEAEENGRTVVRDHYVLTQSIAGATIAARFTDKEKESVGREVERIARSITLTRKVEDAEKK